MLVAFASMTALALSDAAHAGAWTKAAGEISAIMTVSLSCASEAFDASGALSSTPKFRKEDIDIYGEFGLDDETTLVLHPDYINLHPDSPSQSASGFYFTELGLRRQLYRDDLQVASGQVSALITGETLLTSGGNGAEIRALYGRNFHLGALPAFLDVELAYRAFTNGVAQELRPELTLGLHLDPDWMLMAQSLNSLTVGSGISPYFEGERQKLSLSVLHNFSPHFGLQTGFYLTVAGRSTPQEHVIQTSLWIDF